MGQRAFLPIVLSFAILACDDDGTGTSDNAGGAGGATSASSGTTSSVSSTVTNGAGGQTSTSATSGSTATSSASSGTGGAPALGSKTGQIGVFSGATSQSEVGYSVTAGFVERPDASPGVFVESTVGPCAIKTFSTPEVFGPKIAESAGDVTITGGAVPLTLTPDGMNKYAKQKSTTVDLHAGGETLTISATGATIPAFTRDLVAPSYLDVTSPVQPANNDPLPLDRTQDLVFTWNGGGTGEFVVLLGDSATSMTCKFPTTPGTATVPAAALSMLEPGSHGLFLMQAASTEVVTAGDWTVQIIVASSLLWNGAADSQSFSYQASN